MPPLTPTGGPPWLSLLIFAPIVAAVVAGMLRGERALRVWTLWFTVVEAVASLGLLTVFDPGTARFQLVERWRWIPTLNLEYALGVDGVSVLLILLTTLVMPLCVLASWTYIRTRLKEFLVC
ncbi:MAG: NADH-quinone oxidoreductase subunit M, partial [Nitrospira sp.]|nr:NADH-quinone oxidoreductase subunit M [Nitrospira sp.]